MTHKSIPTQAMDFDGTLYRFDRPSRRGASSGRRPSHSDISSNTLIDPLSFVIQNPQTMAVNRQKKVLSLYRDILRAGRKCGL